MDDHNIQALTSKQEKQLIINPKIWNDKTERLLTPDFIKLLGNLHLCLNEERKAILDYRLQINKALQKDFEKVITEQHVDINNFEIDTLPHLLESVKTFMTCPANQTRSLIKLINGNERYLKPDAVTIDFSSGLKPLWSNMLEGFNNINEIANESARFSQQTFAEFSLAGQQPQPGQPLIVIKPRAVHCVESNITIGEENCSASVLDIALLAFHTFRTFTSKSKLLLVTIECCNQFEAQWWNELFTVVEDCLKLEAGCIKIVAVIDAVTGVAASDAIVYELRNRVVALQADFKGKIINDLKLLQKNSDRIVAERKSLSMNEPSLKTLSQHVVTTCRRYNLKAIAGLSINAAGQFVDFKDVSIAKYEEELKELIKFGFDALTVSHQGYIEQVNEKSGWNGITGEAGNNEKNLLPVASQKISMLGLRDNIRTSITWMHAWNQGIASAVFDNRVEDLQTFEIIRAQIYQWIRNSVHLTTGERINSRLITTIILEESEKLQNEIRDEFAGNPVSEIHTILNTYTQAALEVEQLFLKDELLPYFGNVN